MEKLLRSALLRNWLEVDLLQFIQLPQCDQCSNHITQKTTKQNLGRYSHMNLLRIKDLIAGSAKLMYEKLLLYEKQKWTLLILMEHGAHSVP